MRVCVNVGLSVNVWLQCFLHVSHCSKIFTGINSHLLLKITYEVWTIVTPTLKIRKLRHREASQPAQVSSARKW